MGAGPPLSKFLLLFPYGKSSTPSPGGGSTGKEEKRNRIANGREIRYNKEKGGTPRERKNLRPAFWIYEKMYG